MKPRVRISRRVRAALGGVLTAGILVGGAGVPQAQAADFIKGDLDFILAQIKISEQHANGVPLHTPDNPFTPADESAASLVPKPTLPYGVRTVDGKDNNLQPGQRDFGSADTAFPRSASPLWRMGEMNTLFGPPSPTNYDSAASVVDSEPRKASNLIVDQTSDNPAATAAFEQNDRPGKAIEPDNDPGSDLYFLPNKATDEGLSASYNSWFTLFGQFFDHGLDLVTKGGNGTVFVPLQPDDNLYNHPGPDGVRGDDPLTLDDPLVDGIQNDESADDPPNYMLLTRATQIDAQRNTRNTTTPFVDQNQTYTSHPAHQVFLREHRQVVDAGSSTGQRTVATGRFLDDANGGIATWNDVKAQSAAKLGIQLTDLDVLNVPLLRTDPYGRLLTGSNGLAQYATGTAASPVWQEANGGPLPTNAVRTGHAFLDDIAHLAAPTGDLDGNVNTQGPGARGNLEADPDTDIGITEQKAVGLSPQYYDDELLGRHFITGDGRGNENIGLTTVHFVFHAEHNRLAEQAKDVVLAAAQADPIGGLAYLNEWLATPVATVPAGTVGDNPTLDWNGERIFQAARFGTEMQYQHLVFEEFARKVQPEINIFAGYHTDIDPKIVAEFAHAVYRFGHSMLNEQVPRTNPDGSPNDLGLIEAFLNPVEFDNPTLYPGATPGSTDPKKAAGAVIRGTTRQVANELDEFITGALRDNLLGLPLDLATLNLARGRDTGTPPLNQARRDFYAASGHTALTPYESWADFGTALRHPESLVNFIAAYGTHPDLVAATTGAQKRAVAYAIVYGAGGADGNVATAGDNPTVLPPIDRDAFLMGTDHFSSNPATGTNPLDVDGVTRTGLGNIDLWIGGLAERQMPFGGLLGSTFNYVFETQMEQLQAGDRFYYLARTAGIPFLTALEENSFSLMIAENTDNKHLPLDVFSRPDFIFEVGHLPAISISAPIPDEPSSPDNENTHLTRMLDGTVRFVGGEHVLIAGADNHDKIRVDDGDDTVLGDGGNDRLEGGAGNDGLDGGSGNDVLTDIFGIDNIKAGSGNDAIHAGAGTGDLSFGGPGKDAIFNGTDDKEAFLGTGDDFVKGSDGVDTIFGNEGDDWIEGGAHADLLQGGNGDPFQEDGSAGTHTGNDVIIGDGGDDDYDSEGGDDIMVSGPGIERNEGMLGFDWVTATRDPQAAQADLRFTGLLPPDVDALRDRFDLVEGLSGYTKDDILRGDDRTVAVPGGEVGGDMAGHELSTQAQKDLITGLDTLLTDAGVTEVTGGNVLLGGAGSDILEGRGGDDIIDGDRWLDVTLTAPGAPAAGYSSISQLHSQLFGASPLNPGSVHIVRSIKTGADAPDTAVFSEPRANYDIDTTNPDRVIVTHSRGGGAPATPGVDGTDILMNVETLQFSDSSFTLGPGLPNDPPDGVVLVTDAASTLPDDTPFENQLLRASANIIDGDGIPGGFTFTWEAETAPGLWGPAPGGNGADFVPSDSEVGKRLRVVATFVDGLGVPGQVTSDPTGAVAGVNDAPSGAPAIDRQDARVGRPLTASPGTLADADGPTPIDPAGVTYQWQRQNLIGPGFSNIPGATGDTYTPTAADLTRTLRVLAGYTDGQGTAESVPSAETLTTRDVAGGRAILVLGQARVPAVTTARAVTTGVTVAINAPTDTRLMRLRVFRGSAPTPTATAFVPLKAGANKVKLRQKVIVRALKRGGVFRIEMTPGVSKTDLGTPTVRRIVVRRAPTGK